MCALLLLPAVPGSCVRCGRVCWGPGFGCTLPLLGEVLSGCACGRVCARLAPALPGGPPVARRCAGVAVGGVCHPPPSPFGFFWGGGLFVVGRWLSRSWVSWSLSPLHFSSGPPCLLFVFFFSSVVCVRVFWVSLLPVGRCPRLRVAGFGWVVPRRPFLGSCLRCHLGGGFGRPLSCWWAAWWLWAVLAPPPLLFFFGGGLPVPPSTFPGLAHALVGILCGFPVFCMWLRFARPCPGPMGRWVMYTLGSAPLPAGLGSGSAGWAVVPGGFVWPWVSRVPSSQRCRF